MSDETSDSEIICQVRGAIGHILLNRPKALNALTHGKVRAMDSALRSWAKEGAVRTVVVEGAGEKSFCAGGDIRALYEAGKEGNEKAFSAFFTDEYRLNRLIKTFPKPYVAIMDGITMGGGVGISVHGTHRIATERTVFAMPETGIGMFPDVGGTYFLPRLPGFIGTYLALTGARMKAADCVYTGLATHYVPSERVEALVEAIGQGEDIGKALGRVGGDAGPAPLAEHREVIDRCFAGDSVEAILGSLRRDGGEWGRAQAEVIEAKSPLALKVALRQMQVGRSMDFDDCMRTEYRIAHRIAGGPDFMEGVRAVLIDKDNAPRWTPARLQDVTDADVAAVFAPLPSGDLTF